LFITFTGSGSPLTAQTFGTASGTITTVTATGGTFPYTYAVTAPVTPPVGMAVDTSGHVSTSALTPAGTYNGVVVTATDVSSTPLTGTATFQIVVNLKMANTTATPQANGGSGVLTAVTATVNTGTLSYALDSASVTAGLAIDSSGNVTPGTATAGTYSITVTATDGSVAPGATSAATGVTSTISVTVS